MSKDEEKKQTEMTFEAMPGADVDNEEYEALDLSFDTVEEPEKPAEEPVAEES